MYDFDKHKEDNKGSNAKRLLEHKDDEIQRFRDTVEHLEKLLREANDGIQHLP
jgi:glutaredoxin 2